MAGSFRGHFRDHFRRVLKIGIDGDHDIAGPDTTHAVFGVQGLAPYMFEGDAALFLSHRGDLTARIEGDTLWGLGSADMKSGLAVFLELAETVAEPAVDVTYVFYVAEEIAAILRPVAKPLEVTAFPRPQVVLVIGVLVFRPAGLFGRTVVEKV